MPGTDFLLSVYTPWGVWFLASIKCIYDNDFHLSFYFICSTIFDIEVSDYVGFCRIMSDFVGFCRTNMYTIYCIHYYSIMYIAYNIYSFCILHTLLFYYVYCIQYIFLLYIAYIIILLFKMYTIFFPYSLDKVHFICFANFISNILIPLKSQVKTYKKNIFLFSIDLCFKVCLLIYILLPTCQALKHS